MAKKKTLKQLREEAQKLMEQAKKEEESRHQKIGEMFVKFIESDFKGFSVEDFKKKAKAIWEE